MRITCVKKNNVAPFSNNTPVPQPEAVTLQEVYDLMENWRKNKTNVSEKIPDYIWAKIFGLLNTEPKSRICSALGISTKQLRSKLDSRQSDDTFIREVDFCEANASEFPLDYKPAEAFTTKTSVVELYRPDGMLMKIHICTDRFAELLEAFYKGSN